MGNQLIGKMWIAVCFVVAFAFLWFTRHVLLLLFAAVLIAIMLTSLGNLLRRFAPLGRKTAFAAVLLFLVGMLLGVGWLMGASIADQFGELAEQIPKLFSEARERITSSSIFQKIQGLLPSTEDVASSGGSQVVKAFSSTFASASSFIFIIFAALFLAASPDLYVRMLIRLFPPRWREDAGQTVGRIVDTLKYWLVGQLISMSVVGLITGVALALVGIPFALELGILAGLGEFVPFIGPILVSIPALLLALNEGTQQFLIVLAIVLGIQFLESNVLMPVVQRKAIEMPPVVTLSAVLILGTSFGLLGLFVAAPLVAVVLVLIEELYLKRFLHTTDKLLD